MTKRFAVTARCGDNNGGFGQVTVMAPGGNALVVPVCTCEEPDNDEETIALVRLRLAHDPVWGGD